MDVGVSAEPLAAAEAATEDQRIVDGDAVVAYEDASTLERLLHCAGTSVGPRLRTGGRVAEVAAFPPELLPAITNGGIHLVGTRLRRPVDGFTGSAPRMSYWQPSPIGRWRRADRRAAVRYGAAPMTSCSGRDLVAHIG